MSTDSLVISVNRHKDFTSCSLNVRYVHVLSIHEQSPHTKIEKRNRCNQCGVIGKYVSGSENEIVNSRSRS